MEQRPTIQSVTFNKEATGILKRHKQGTGIDSLLQGSAAELRKKNELSHKKKSDPQLVTFLMVNILLTIKMNASLLSVQRIYGHIAKYVSIPEHW